MPGIGGCVAADTQEATRLGVYHKDRPIDLLNVQEAIRFHRREEQLGSVES